MSSKGRKNRDPKIDIAPDHTIILAPKIMNCLMKRNECFIEPRTKISVTLALVYKLHLSSKFRSTKSSFCKIIVPRRSTIPSSLLVKRRGELPLKLVETRRHRGLPVQLRSRLDADLGVVRSLTKLRFENRTTRRTDYIQNSLFVYMRQRDLMK